SAVPRPPAHTVHPAPSPMRASACPLSPRAPTENVLVLYGDTPLLRGETLARLLAEQERAPAAVLLAGMRPVDPGPYGRLISAADGAVQRIVEAADATAEESAIGLCWGGLMLIQGRPSRELIAALDPRP